MSANIGQSQSSGATQVSQPSLSHLRQRLEPALHHAWRARPVRAYRAQHEPQPLSLADAAPKHRRAPSATNANANATAAAAAGLACQPAAGPLRDPGH
jgi:hypothetical protein